MNLILLHESERTPGGTYVFRGARARHVREVLAAGPGDTVRVGVLEGPRGTAEVLRAGDDEVELRATLDARPPPRPETDLVLAIPRPKMLRRLLPQLAALGVDRLVLLRTWRVGKPYLTARVLRPDAYRPLLHAGLMQARCTREPRVAVEPLFRPFAEDRAPGLAAAAAAAFVAHPSAPDELRHVPLRAGRRVFAIGPEGGFLPFEVDLLAAAGFRPVALGERIWRVDTACVAVLGLGALRADASAHRESASGRRASGRLGT